MISLPNSEFQAVAKLVDEMQKLNVEQQLALNKALVALIKGKRKAQAAAVGSQFNIGQIVVFNAKTRGIKRIKIEKFNRAGTAVVGWECDTSGVKFAGGQRWTVATTLCK